MIERSVRLPRIAGAIGGVLLLIYGLWALVAPRSFFETIARFEPYNAHFVQDIGAFQIGLAAALLLAVFWSSDALAVVLFGVGTGASAHVVSHIVGIGSGGNPAVDIPGLSLLGLLLLGAGILRRRQTGENAHDLDKQA